MPNVDGMVAASSDTTVRLNAILQINLRVATSSGMFEITWSLVAPTSRRIVTPSRHDVRYELEDMDLRAG